jgi:hypothetical protein
MVGYYLFLLIILFLFGVYNLFTRVKNDAIVYLHPTLAEGIASRWTILLIAGAGMLLGALLSQEMLVIPRKVIFNPGVFVFSDIVVVFMAMMITDVILLYIFKALAMSSSSIIMVLFELLGSSVAVSLVSIRSMRKSFSDLILFINPVDVLHIIAGIVISVIVAFFAGAMIQYLIRFIFSFKYRKAFLRYGYLYGALLITVVFYFIMINGSGISFLLETGTGPAHLLIWARKYFWVILIISVLLWSMLFLAGRKLFRIDTLKTIILFGVFSLALTMTTNEMVNYAGVPLTSLASFNEWFASGVDANHFRVDFLTMKIHTPYIILGLAGLILVGVLFTWKAGLKDPESVLLPGNRNNEDGPASLIKLARSVTRASLFLNSRLKVLIPEKANQFIRNRFVYMKGETQTDQQVFKSDNIRISVNLYVSIVLIAMATSLKLPVSTVFVVFMVMLGTSLADRAWGRENAVPRISGIFSLFVNWILTAFIALIMAAFIAWIIIVGGKIITVGLIVSTAFIIVRSQIVERRNAKKIIEEEELISEKDEIEKGIEKCTKQVVKTIITTNKIFSFTMDGFLKEDRSQMHQTLELNDELNKKSQKQKNKIIQTISSTKKLDVDSGYFYLQINDYQREISHSLNLLIEPLNEHLENQYKSFNESQIDDLRLLVNETDAFFNFALHIVKDEKFETIDEWVARKDTIFETLTGIEKSQISRIKNKEVSVRNSLLFFKALAEIRNLLIHSVSLIKSYHGFILVNRKNG